MDARQLMTERNQLRSEVEDLTDRLTDVTDDYYSAKEENKQLTARITELEQENAALTARIKEVQDDLIFSDNLRVVADRAKERAEQEKAEHEQMATFCDEERIEALNELNAAKTAIAQKDETIYSQQATMQFLHGQLQTAQTNMDQLFTEIGNLQHQLAALQQHHQVLLAAHWNLLQPPPPEDNGDDAASDASDVNNPEDTDSDA